MRESEIEKYLVKRVKELGGKVRKVVWQGHRGAPDRVVFFPRESFWDFETCVWVELKAPGKKPEPHQLREHKWMVEFGQTVLVIDSKEQVDEWLGN